MTFPANLPIAVLRRPPNATIHVPGSKSLTNRALALAAFADGSSELSGVLQSEDTEVMIECLRKLGVALEVDWSSTHIRVSPRAGGELVSPADLFVANSGTTMRFLTALVSACKGRFRLDGAPRMRERPIQDLLDALAQLGVSARSELGNGCPPIVIETSGLRAGTVRIRGDVSSQFLSGLLLAAPLTDGNVSIELDGPLVSEPYVAMTLGLMRHFGVQVEATMPARRFVVRGGQRYHGGPYAIEPDASAASYFFAAAAITGGTVTIPGLSTSGLQGDVRFVDLLEAMGCRVERAEDALTVTGAKLHGIRADMNDISDTVMSLAAVACFAGGPTTIENVAHIRHKETDRLAALATELRRAGAEVEERPDGLVLQPQPLHGAAIETYNDHRIAMSMSLLGLRIPGMIIHNPACVAKTYPGFFADLEKLAG